MQLQTKLLLICDVRVVGGNIVEEVQAPLAYMRRTSNLEALVAELHKRDATRQKLKKLKGLEKIDHIGTRGPRGPRGSSASTTDSKEPQEPLHLRRKVPGNKSTGPHSFIHPD